MSDDIIGEDLPVSDRPNSHHVTASGILRVALCPGSHELARRHAELPWERNSEYANKGTELHEAQRTQDFTGFDNDDLELLRTCEYQRIDVLKGIFGDNKWDDLRERRYFIRDGLRPILSGQLDHIAIGEVDGRKTAVILDYKMLYGVYESAERNLQFRAQAVLLAESDDFDDIYVAKIQPRRGAPSVALYSRESIARAKEEVLGIVAEAEKPNAPLLAGERQCKYCPARGRCAASRETMDKFAKLKLVERDEEALPNDLLMELYDEASAAISAAMAVKSCLKGRLQVYAEADKENELTEKFELKSKLGRREISSSEEAWARLHALTPEHAATIFSKSCNVKIAALEKEYRLASVVGTKSDGSPKYITHKAAKEEIAEALDGLVSQNERSPEVERK